MDTRGEIRIELKEDIATVAAILVKNGYAVVPTKKKVGRLSKNYLNFMPVEMVCVKEEAKEEQDTADMAEQTVADMAEQIVNTVEQSYCMASSAINDCESY